LDSIKKIALTLVDKVLSKKGDEEEVRMFCKLSNVVLSAVKTELAIKMIEKRNSEIRMIE